MADDLDRYKIKQLSIFSENRPGRLMDFSKAMGEENINILAFSIAEGAGYGVIRAFVSDPEKALKRLQEHGFVVRYTDVIAINMADKPGGLLRADQGAQGRRHQHRVRLRLPQRARAPSW